MNNCLKAVITVNLSIVFRLTVPQQHFNKTTHHPIAIKSGFGYNSATYFKQTMFNQVCTQTLLSWSSRSGMFQSLIHYFFSTVKLLLPVKNQTVRTPQQCNHNRAMFTTPQFKWVITSHSVGKVRFLWFESHKPFRSTDGTINNKPVPQTNTQTIASVEFWGTHQWNVLVFQNRSFKTVS